LPSGRLEEKNREVKVRKSSADDDGLRQELEQMQERVEILASFVLIFMGSPPPSMSPATALAVHHGLAAEALDQLLPSFFNGTGNEGQTRDTLIQRVLDRHGIVEDKRIPTSKPAVTLNVKCARLRDEIRRAKDKLFHAPADERKALYTTIHALEQDLEKAEKKRNAEWETYRAERAAKAEAERTEKLKRFA
jgi:hypothetical protein